MLRVEGRGERVEGCGLRVEGSGLRVWGTWLRAPSSDPTFPTPSYLDFVRFGSIPYETVDCLAPHRLIAKKNLRGYMGRTEASSLSCAATTAAKNRLCVCVCVCVCERVSVCVCGRERVCV